MSKNFEIGQTLSTPLKKSFQEHAGQPAAKNENLHLLFDFLKAFAAASDNVSQATCLFGQLAPCSKSCSTSWTTKKGLPYPRHETNSGLLCSILIKNSQKIAAFSFEIFSKMTIVHRLKVLKMNRTQAFY